MQVAMGAPVDPKLATSKAAGGHLRGTYPRQIEQYTAHLISEPALQHDRVQTLRRIGLAAATLGLHKRSGVCRVFTPRTAAPYRCKRTHNSPSLFQ